MLQRYFKINGQNVASMLYTFNVDCIMTHSSHNQY